MTSSERLKEKNNFILNAAELFTDKRVKGNHQDLAVSMPDSDHYQTVLIALTN